MKATPKKTFVAAKNQPVGMGSLFGKTNKLWMLIGIGVMIAGFLLMAGGASKDPNVFNKNEVYGTTRITVAPILILAGLVIEIIAIFRQPKSEEPVA